MQILINTPFWVYILFFALLFLGLSQSKNRELSLKKAIVLPSILLILSLFGTISAFGLNIEAIFLWSLGILFGISFTISFSIPKTLVYDSVKKIFLVKGSFLPLILIMLIFFLKYFVGVIKATNSDLLNIDLYIFTISFFYGLFSGLFFGRVFVFLKKLRV